MKKIFFTAILVLAFTGIVSAQERYTVESVTGRVEQEANGKRVEVKAGDVLDEQTVIHTGLGASVTVRSGNQNFIIRAMSNGTVKDLSAEAIASGLRISGKVAETDTGSVSRTAGKISTASARASDAAEEYPVTEE
ncbi:hypothetical protein [Leadbettera azotonutricia]|uniref:DUF5666 domain-containing protein n=1 Tax=Leadbettera azotonutricia (strain ATCC BAA-888 / DSM 13862 / ZAS-9) TaxID=545695 RepID=F5YAP6_LEAAZ|nr:hypothetical protein [Leadbettera azotonutricia]AEF80992.1 hypothetical protein TREAZ_1958 [Leadbettera azotonutricia ZAS-9]